MQQRTINIALLGCGVVGAGVAHILCEQRELIRQRTGLSFNIRHIVVRDLQKNRGPRLRLQQPLSVDPVAAINDPEVQIVVELIGGTTAAGELIELALRQGKHIITANKSLLASRGPELFAIAKRHNASIAFEASCGGGIPIINALIHGLVANRIDALVGIINGTCNFILTKMTRSGASYADALAEAQQAGFAEADPAMDVSGRDAAQKLALLAGLAFNALVKESDIHIEGIDTIEPADIEFARELGYVIKLLAIAERSPGNSPAAGHGGGSTGLDAPITLRVHPTLVHKDDVLAEVSGSFNAISVYGHALGHALFYGRGAGQMPTASAVVADLVSTALGLTPAAFAALNIFPDTTPPASVLPFEQLQSRYYLRLMARDEPGVLAQVTRILGTHKISLSAILQHEANNGQSVPVVITTHRANEGAMQRALKEIAALSPIAPPTVCLRIIDQPKEFLGS
ncbi:MAG TPA: homoserine dehydrogenase [Tepidisphaeraceae bacterium]|jgi:homoserine dehydrogenase